MNNLDCAIAVLAAHREARQWNDETVAHDMLAKLGVDPVGVAPGVIADEPVVEPVVDEPSLSQGDETVRLLTEQREAADAAPAPTSSNLGHG